MILTKYQDHLGSLFPSASTLCQILLLQLMMYSCETKLKHFQVELFVTQLFETAKRVPAANTAPFEVPVVLFLCIGCQLAQTTKAKVQMMVTRKCCCHEYFSKFSDFCATNHKN